MAKTTKTAVKRTPTKAAATAKKTTAKKAVTLTNAEKKAALESALQAKTSGASASPFAGAPAAPAPVDNRSPAELASTQSLGQSLADHNLETHQAAAGLAQGLAAPYAADGVREATNERVSAIDAAVAARASEAKRLADEQARTEQGQEALRVENLSVPLGSAGAQENHLRVPAGIPRAPLAVPQAGISPDVTSPVTGPVVQVPGTGVARLSELAPGQSLAPSPPISSSNILPQPD